MGIQTSCVSCDSHDPDQLNLLTKELVDKAMLEAGKGQNSVVAFGWPQLNEIFGCIDVWYNHIMFVKEDHADYGRAFEKHTFFLEQMIAILATHKVACRFNWV